MRVENAFEGLIDKYTFMVVANLLERDTRKSAGGIALLQRLGGMCGLSSEHGP